MEIIGIQKMIGSPTRMNIRDPLMVNRTVIAIIGMIKNLLRILPMICIMKLEEPLSFPMRPHFVIILANWCNMKRPKIRKNTDAAVI